MAERAGLGLVLPGLPIRVYEANLLSFRPDVKILWVRLRRAMWLRCDLVTGTRARRAVNNFLLARQRLLC